MVLFSTMPTASISWAASGVALPPAGGSAMLSPGSAAGCHQNATPRASAASTTNRAISILFPILFTGIPPLCKGPVHPGQFFRGAAEHTTLRPGKQRLLAEHMVFQVFQI